MSTTSSENIIFKMEDIDKYYRFLFFFIIPMKKLLFFLASFVLFAQTILPNFLYVQAAEAD
jgi:hypothetical protein